jgi:pyruvate dehydrogenase E2 component (dihydrolipoamide acetyltransferase)
MQKSETSEILLRNGVIFAKNLVPFCQKSCPATVTHHVSVDVANLLTLRKTLNDDREENEKISISDLLVKIVAKALEIKPHINVTLDKNEIRVLSDINIGLAVALEKGLVVPVIKNANKKSLSEISREVKELAQKARASKISPEEMRGGTFTITNLGAYGSVDWFTPIINQPESAILGIGRIVEQPVVYEGRVTIRPMMGLSLAFDHRVIDGAPAAEFLAVMLKLIESPMKVLI